MTLMPAFDQFPKEAELIGRMVTSFGELELTYGLIAGTALRDQILALRAMYRVRSTGGRIDLADTIIRNQVLKTDMVADYDHVLSVLRHCLRIRNNYAHGQWAPGTDGLYFTDLETSASRAQGFEMDQRHVGMPLLSEQAEFFAYCRSIMLWFGDQLEIKLSGRGLGFARPAKKGRPAFFDPASQHIPNWYSEESKRRHLERALETEQREPPAKRPPSVLRLTEDEWIAKYRKEGRTLP